jgi:hypothetical protein
MAYEVFDNKATRLGSPALTIATDGRLALNADAGDLLKGLGAKFVHLLWDAEARKIALRPLAKADSRSYKLSVPHAHKRGMLVSGEPLAMDRTITRTAEPSGICRTRSGGTWI